MAKRLTKKKQVKLVDQAAREIRIRLSRWGCTNRPFFHIVVADSKAPRNGRHYEQVWSFTRGVRHWIKFCTRFNENSVISPIYRLKNSSNCVGMLPIKMFDFWQKCTRFQNVGPLSFIAYLT